MARGAAGRLADAAAFQQLQADKQAAAQQAARDKEEIEKLRAELSSVKSVALCSAQRARHRRAGATGGREGSEGGDRRGGEGATEHGHGVYCLGCPAEHGVNAACTDIGRLVRLPDRVWDSYPLALWRRG